MSRRNADHGSQKAGSAGGARVALVPRVPGQEPVNRASARTVTAVIVVVALFLYLVRAILLPFVISGAVAFVCAPLVERIARLVRVPRWAAAALVSILMIGAAAGLAALALPPLTVEIKGTLENLQPTLERLAALALGSGHVRFLGQETDAAQLAAHVMDGLRQALGQSDVVAAIALGGVSGAIGLLMTMVLFVYFMIGGPSIACGLLWLVPPNQRPLVQAVWRELDPILFRYFAGLAIVVVYATVAAYIGLSFVLGLPHATVLAVLTGLLEMVPIIGPIASALVAGLFAVRAATSPADIIAYIVYVIALRLSIDQLVSPLVLGRAGRVHPVVIIFCFLAGGVLFNIVGIILAIPVALAIKTILAALYEEPLVSEKSRS